MEVKERENKKHSESEQISLPANVDKIIPKFCTAITISLINTKNLVLTMVYNEGKENGAIIERIVIDLEHAKSLNNVLNKLLKDAENDSTKSK